jgi:hypothetical protein
MGRGSNRRSVDLQPGQQADAQQRRLSAARRANDRHEPAWTTKQGACQQLPVWLPSSAEQDLNMALTWCAWQDSNRDPLLRRYGQ